MLSNLPENDADFVGRRTELADLADALKRCRLVTATGMGGVGKSRLALRAAHTVRDGGARGVAWADLWPLRDDRLLIATVADAADFSDHTATMPLDALCEWLADKDAVLVLDSCEHLVSACRHLVAHLVMTCPDLTVLATSREPLGVPGEHVYALEPLPAEPDAVELLRRRAAAAGTPLTDVEDIATATRLCRWLEGIPLALELVAGQLARHTVTEVERDLRSRLDVRARAVPAGPQRHRAMRTAIGWSHELCAPAERLLWARMSVFRGPVDPGAVRAVCGGEPLPAADVEATMAGLAAKSVLSRTRDGYRMLDTVREYGGMWLDGVGETPLLADRHAEHFLSLARTAHRAWLGPRQAVWYGKVERAHADLCAALDHLLVTRPAAALAAATEPGPERARALWGLGVARVLRGEHTAATALAEACRAEAQARQDGEGLLHAAYLEGLIHLLQGRPMTARWVVDEALDLAAGPAFSSRGRVLCRLVRVFALTSEGLLGRARGEAGELHGVCVALGEWWTRAYCDYQLALVALFEERVKDAAAHAVSMLEGKRRIGDSFGLALGLDLLASALAAQGAGEPAVAAYGAGETFWSAVGHPQRGTPELAPVRARYEATARTLLGDETYEEVMLRTAGRDPESVLVELLGRSADGG
ncbi:regulator [Streptomyces sp. NPDC005526]|uniref:ATP-binding protein n=1 Tax=Streptomyces sp. NPDC005526 TaxID=3156885 RepID=UPI0033A72189